MARRTMMLEGIPVLVVEGRCYDCWTGESLGIVPEEGNGGMAELLELKEKAGKTEADGAQMEADCRAACLLCQSLIDEVVRIDPSLAWRAEVTEIEARSLVARYQKKCTANPATAVPSDLYSQCKSRCDTALATLDLVVQKKSEIQVLLCKLLAIRESARPPVDLSDLDY